MRLYCYYLVLGIDGPVSGVWGMMHKSFQDGGVFPDCQDMACDGLLKFYSGETLTVRPEWTVDSHSGINDMTIRFHMNDPLGTVLVAGQGFWHWTLCEIDCRKV